MTDTPANRLEALRRANPLMIIESCMAPRFTRYGAVIEGIDAESFAVVSRANPLPDDGVVYTASVPELDALPVTRTMAARMFGELAVQAGWVRGRNRTLNALEYHKSIEVNVAVTDLVLLLAHRDDLSSGRIAARCVEAFYVPPGTALELFSATLHFAPVQVDENGFCAIVILPRGTNLPLDEGLPGSGASGEDRLLFMKNKWLVAAPGSPQAERGAFVGLEGERIVVKGVSG